LVIHIYIVLIPLVLFFGALFAAAEASLFSLSQTQLDTLRQTRPSTYKAIHALIRKPEELLSTIVVGNEALSILRSERSLYPFWNFILGAGVRR